jgi:selenocysteine-specific translation elongation factor
MTGSVTVAVVGSPGVAKELGKKGTFSDVTLFNEVRDGHATTFVEPTQFPEKLAPLLVTLGMADRCLLVITELTRPVAETIAVVELSELPTTLVLGPAVGEAEVARVLRGSRLASAPQVPLDPPHLRETVDGWNAEVREGPVEVPIDHAFPVKGVGTVALGVVRRGTLRAHDRLRLWPDPTLADVRSIQVHDLDRKEAECGERVGVALKDLDVDQVSRGQVMAPEGSLRAGPELAGGGLIRCPYYRGDAGPGAQVHVALGLQVVPAALSELSPNSVRLTCDRPVVYAPGKSAILLDLSVPVGPRVIGRTVLSA